jgi:outer membrane lipoprotein carrier protein
MMIAAALLILGVSLSGSPPGQPPPDPREIASRLQARYDTVRDLSADFVHVYEGGVLRRKSTERGTVLMKKPGKMRWTYAAPEKKLFVADGQKFWAYVPEDRQVVVTTLPPGDQVGAATLLLAGKGNLLRDYAVSAAEVSERPPDTWAIKLVPLREQADYDWLVLVVDVRGLGIRMLITADSQGGQSTFTFTNVRENKGLPDREFTFKVPRGVDVITDGRNP